MIRVGVFILMAVLIVVSCNTEETAGVDIELTIYPSSGGSQGYKITISNDTLTATSNKISIQDERVVLADVTSEASLSLSDEQSTTLVQYVSVQTPREYKSDYDEFMLDTWMYVIFIGGQEFDRFNSITLHDETPQEEELDNARKLVKYLLELCPLELRLDSFS